MESGNFYLVFYESKSPIDIAYSKQIVVGMLFFFFFNKTSYKYVSVSFQYGLLFPIITHTRGYSIGYSWLGLEDVALSKYETSQLSPTPTAKNQQQQLPPSLSHIRIANYLCYMLHTGLMYTQVFPFSYTF